MKRFFIPASAILFASSIFGRSTITEEAVESLMVAGYFMDNKDESLKDLATRHITDHKPLSSSTIEMLGDVFVTLAEKEPKSQQIMMMPLLQEVKKQDTVLSLRIQRIEKHFEENVGLNNLLKDYDVVDVDSISPFHPEDPIKTAAMKAKQITISDIFNGADYKQDYNDGACMFLSTLAGVMYTDQERKKVQELLVGQDADHVYFKFHAPLINRKGYDHYTKDQVAEFEEYARFVESLKKTVCKVKKSSMTVDDFYPKKTADWVHLLMRAYYGLTKIPSIRAYVYSDAKNWTVSPTIALHVPFSISQYSLIVGKKAKTYYENDPLQPHGQLKAMLLSGNYISTGTDYHASVFLIDGNKELLFYDNQVGVAQPVPEFKGKNIQDMTEQEFIDKLFQAVARLGLNPRFDFLYAP